MIPKKIEEELENIAKKYKLSKRQVEELRKLVEEEYEKLKVEPGEAVGVVASQSMGEPATQMILRSFHFVGVAELQLTLSLPRIIEIVNAKKKPSFPTMRIYLKEPYNKDEEKVKEVAERIREIKIENIMKEITLNVVNSSITLILDENSLKEIGLTDADILSVLKRSFKSCTAKIVKKNTIELKPRKKEISIKYLYALKNKLKEVLVSGIRGIEDVMVTFDEENKEWYIQTFGSNLEEVMKVPEVDETRVYTNDIMEIYRVLGVEAARQAIVNEIVAVLERQGLDIDIRHILLLADIMTVNGRVEGVTRYGITKRKKSVLARAAFEIPIKHFIDAALQGESDKLRGVAENIMLNQIIPVGTGMVKLLYSRPTNVKKEKAKKSKKKH